MRKAAISHIMTVRLSFFPYKERDSHRKNIRNISFSDILLKFVDTSITVEIVKKNTRSKHFRWQVFLIEKECVFCEVRNEL